MKLKNIIETIKAHPGFAMIFLSAFVIVLYLVVVSLQPLDLLNDSKDLTWIEMVDNVEDGRGYRACPTSYIPNCKLTDQLTAMREPVPVLLYAVYIALTREYIIFLQGIQLLFNLLILWGIYFLGTEIKDRLLGLIAAGLWAVYLPIVRVEIHLNGDLVAGVCITYGMLIFVRAIKYGHLKYWLWFGFIFGLAILSRSSSITFAASMLGGYAFYLWMIKKNITVTVTKNMVLAGIVMILTVSPWIIRNQIVFGEPMMGTTLIGYNMYRHNAIVGGDDFYPHYVGPDEAALLMDEFIAAHPEMNTPINEAQVNGIFKDEAVKLMLANPKEYVLLVAYRFIPLWFNLGVLEQYGNPMTILDYLVVIQQIILLGAFVFVMWKGNFQTRLLALGLPFFLFSYMAIGSQLRYFVPVAPVIITISALTFPYLWPRYFSNSDSYA